MTTHALRRDANRPSEDRSFSAYLRSYSARCVVGLPWDTARLHDANITSFTHLLLWKESAARESARRLWTGYLQWLEGGMS